MCNIFSFTLKCVCHSMLPYLFWTILQKHHQSWQLVLQSLLPEWLIVISVLATSLSTTEWRTTPRNLSWYHSTQICPTILFLLLGLLYTYVLDHLLYISWFFFSWHITAKSFTWKLWGRSQDFITPAVNAQLQLQLSSLDITSSCYKDDFKIANREW